MYKLLRYWNQNKGKILITIAVIALVIAFIRIANEIIKNQNEDNTNINNINEQKAQDVTKPTESYTTGQKINETTTEQNTNIIKNFVQYCNNNQTEQAYELLSDDCKMEFGNNINTFINNYYNKIFATKKTYNLEFLLSDSGSYTYKITYHEDNLLATGGNISNNNFEDYVSIINQNDENKISISGFIKKVEINKTQMLENIEVIVNSKKVYRSYEKYNITIKNRSTNTIKISDGQNSNDICLIDKNDVQYPSFINEVPINFLELVPGRQINFDIKFNKIYGVYRQIEKMQFSNITLSQGNTIKLSIDI